MIHKILRGVHRVFSRMPFDPRVAPLQASFAAEASQLRSISPSGVPNPVIAVQGVEDPLFYGLFAALSLDVRRRTGARGKILLVRSINSAIGTGWLPWIARCQPLNWLVTSQWVRANAGIVGPVAYRSQSFAHPLGDLQDVWRAWQEWRGLQGCADISDYAIDGVQVGDLIIDSFLRFRPSPRFRVEDRFVWRILWQALRDLRRARAFFDTVRPAVYLSSYATYVEHGVAVRVALQAGVTVRVFGNLTTFGKRLSLSDVFHTPDTSAYRATFEHLNATHQANALEQARQQLQSRLSGVIDSATSYMKVSAYAATEELVPDVRDAVVVFLHDFYDSPHVYDDLIFPDFWAWISCTIETLQASGARLFLKPHPNQIALSGEALVELREAYPDLQMLSPRLTNVQLVEAGMCCGVTVYGTVAHELAFLGVPTISCARHPHHAFAFSRTAHSIDEYRAFLRSPGTLPMSVDDMRREALAFFYMHNIHGGDEVLALRRHFVQLWKLANGHGATGESILAELQALRQLPGYRAFLELLTQEASRHVSC